MHAVALADLLGRQAGRLVANRVDLLLHLGQHRGLFQEPHVHVKPALDVELLVERVEVMPHGLVVVRGAQGLLVRHVRAADPGDLLDIGEHVDAALLEDLLGHRAGRHDRRGIPPAEEARPDGVVVRAVLEEARIGGVSRPGRAVGVLVLLDVDEMAVQVRDQDRQGRAVGMVLVAGVLDGVGRVETGVDDGQIGLLARAGQLIGPGLAQEQIAIDLLLAEQNSRRHALQDARESFLVRAAGDRHLKTASDVTSEHVNLLRGHVLNINYSPFVSRNS